LDGDPMFVEIVQYAGDKLGVGVANLLNLLNPKAVVLGGGIARAGDLLLDAVNRTIRGRSLSASIGNAEIRVSGLNEWGVAVGAATLALEAALETPSLFHAESIGAL
ncbi:MAG: ROK family protein, partial [Myxococcales bacterium]|nr:ROK family protein [Myxococcales bacterium]